MLTRSIESYLALRRATGFSLHGTSDILLNFAGYASIQGDTHVRTHTAIAWASRGRSPERCEYLIRKVILFARHARAEDPKHEIPPYRIFSRLTHHRPIPFIFTPDQICQLVTAAYKLKPIDPLRPYTYGTLISLLASTGIRISEALALHLNDITDDGLLIRQTKFRKRRLVPLHETAAAGLQRYLERRLHTGGEFLFVHRCGRPLSYSIVRWTYTKLIGLIGLKSQPGRPRARLHCLRHTFAVRALEACPSNRNVIANHQLGLAT